MIELFLPIPSPLVCSYCCVLCPCLDHTLTQPADHRIDGWTHTLTNNLDIQTQTHIQTNKHTHTQTESQTHRQRQRNIYKQKNTHADIDTDTHTNKYTNRHLDTQTKTQTHIQTNDQTHTDKQKLRNKKHKDSQTYTHIPNTQTNTNNETNDMYCMLYILYIMC